MKNNKQLRAKIQDTFNDCTSGWLITIKDFNDNERTLGSLENEIIDDLLALFDSQLKAGKRELLEELEEQAVEYETPNFNHTEETVYYAVPLRIIKEKKETITVKTDLKTITDNIKKGNVETEESKK